MTTALVTGATRSPGRVIATTLADAGWEVHALGRDRVALDEMRGDHGVLPMAMDLTDRDYVRSVVEGMEPDVLVHAALRWPDEDHFLMLTEADIDMVLEVNLSATIHLTRTVLPSMIVRGRGALVVVSPRFEEASSIVEKTVAAAVSGFTRALSQELSGSGVSMHYLTLGDAPYQCLGEQALSLLSEAGFQSDTFSFSKRQEYSNGT